MYCWCVYMCLYIYKSTSNPSPPSSRWYFFSYWFDQKSSKGILRINIGHHRSTNSSRNHSNIPKKRMKFARLPRLPFRLGQSVDRSLACHWPHSLPEASEVVCLDDLIHWNWDSTTIWMWTKGIKQLEGTKKYMEMKSKLIKQLEGTKKYMKMKRTKNGRLTNKNADGTKKKCYVCNKNRCIGKASEIPSTNIWIWPWETSWIS